MSDLRRQQRVIQEALDPEGAALARMAAEQAAAEEAAELRREALRLALGFWALFMLMAVAHESAQQLEMAGPMLDAALL